MSEKVDVGESVSADARQLLIALRGLVQTLPDAKLAFDDVVDAILEVDTLAGSARDAVAALCVTRGQLRLAREQLEVQQEENAALRRQMDGLRDLCHAQSVAAERQKEELASAQGAVHALQTKVADVREARVSLELELAAVKEALRSANQATAAMARIAQQERDAVATHLTLHAPQNLAKDAEDAVVARLRQLPWGFGEAFSSIRCNKFNDHVPVGTKVVCWVYTPEGLEPCKRVVTGKARVMGIVGGGDAVMAVCEDGLFQVERIEVAPGAVKNER